MSFRDRWLFSRTRTRAYRLVYAGATVMGTVPGFRNRINPVTMRPHSQNREKYRKTVRAVRGIRVMQAAVPRDVWREAARAGTVPRRQPRMPRAARGRTP